MLKRESSATKLLSVYSWLAVYCLLLLLAERLIQGRGVVCSIIWGMAAGSGYLVIWHY